MSTTDHTALVVVPFRTMGICVKLTMAATELLSS